MQTSTSPDRFEYHRLLRNLFAVLRALVRHTSSGHDSVTEFATRLESRIAALARVFDMAMRAPDDGVDLHEMIHEELLFQTVSHDRVEVGGPQIRISPSFATSLALAFHELTLNALMHGALASRSGLVSITWSDIEDDHVTWLLLRWRESGSEVDLKRTRSRGFGLEWIERTLSYELHTRTSVDFRREGVEVEMRIPATIGSDQTIWRPGTAR